MSFSFDSTFTENSSFFNSYSITDTQYPQNFIRAMNFLEAKLDTTNLNQKYELFYWLYELKPNWKTLPEKCLNIVNNIPLIIEKIPFYEEYLQARRDQTILDFSMKYNLEDEELNELEFIFKSEKYIKKLYNTEFNEHDFYYCLDKLENIFSDPEILQNHRTPKIFFCRNYILQILSPHL